MKRLLIISFFIISTFSVFGQAWNTGQVKPAGTVPMVTPDNITFYLDKTDSVLWSKLGRYGDFKMFSAKQVQHKIDSIIALGYKLYADTIDNEGYFTNFKAQFKQDTLSSGINIKTINNISPLGPGNIQIGSEANVNIRQLYFSDNVSGISDYMYLEPEYAHLGAAVAINTITAGTEETYVGGWSLFNFTSPERLIPSGLWKIAFRANVVTTSGKKDATVYAKIFKINAIGTESLILTTLSSSILIDAPTFYRIDVLSEDIILNVGESILVKMYTMALGNGGDPDIEFRYSDQTGTRIEIPDAGTSFHDELNDVNLAAYGIQFGHINDSIQSIAGTKTFSSGLNIPTGKTYKINNSSIIVDAINDAVTTTAPSQNAVFDALALKENAFTKNSAFNKNFGSTTGTVLEGRTFGTVANSATTDFGSSSIYPNSGLTTGYLPYKTAGVLANSPVWTNGTNVGIGTTTPTGRTDIQGLAIHDLPTYSSEFLLTTTWVSTDWTGDFAAGWTHTTGNVSVLSHDKLAVNATKYQIAYTVTGRTAGSFTIGFGGQSNGGITATGAWGPTTTSTSSLTITPTTDFNGTIVISIKSITAVSTPLVNLKSSDGIARIEMRANSTTGNTFIGVGAGRYNTTGSYNTSQGYQALYANTTGIYNTSQGYQALYANTTGSYNTAQGYQALIYNTTGIYNTANGFRALYANTTGSNNTANGIYTLYANTTGSNNTAQGDQAGRFIANGSTGRTTGNNGLYLGYNSKASSDGTDNEIVIGYNAIGNGSNTATLGNTTTTKNYFSGDIYKSGTLLFLDKLKTGSMGTLGQIPVANGVSSDFTWSNGSANFILNQNASAQTANININGNVTANSFIKSGGTSAQYLLADGSTTTVNEVDPKFATDSAYLKSHVRNDLDLSPTNEIQTLSVSSIGTYAKIHLSNADSVTFKSGTGITLSVSNDTITVTGSAGLNYSVQALSGTTPVWNANSGINATLTLSGNTTITLSNLVAGTSGNITVINAATLYTLTVSGYTNKISPAVYSEANILKCSGSSLIDCFSWWYDGTRLIWNGTNDYK